MGNYRLTEDAKEDLKRIYRYGVISHGEKQADIYLDALFERFQHTAFSTSNSYLIASGWCWIYV